MKYLNKVIFINSANIPYAEIAVDGNVHFTGTQGVGKSTVLRALLFFYNADKHRLGIQQGQKPFDEFYFRQSNSYILYEVMRENGAYTILVGRYQGRASWRFIDAPYKREWLITEDKQVHVVLNNADQFQAIVEFLEEEREKANAKKIIVLSREVS